MPVAVSGGPGPFAEGRRRFLSVLAAGEDHFRGRTRVPVPGREDDPVELVAGQVEEEAGDEVAGYRPELLTEGLLDVDRHAHDGSIPPRRKVGK
jgi:hypothetical protein